VEPFSKLTGIVAPLDRVNVDTDQVIPAVYLKRIERTGFGRFLFATWRFNDDGSPKPDFMLNHPVYKEGSILIAGRNFGCGSSREHAPQALQRFGIRTLVGESFAEIFAGNCTVLGLPAVRVAAADLERLQELVRQHPETEVAVDLEAQTVTAGALHCPATLPDGARHALVRGTWDSTTLLLANRDRIAATTARLPYLNAFAER
jgi:3-isopropylmalate/(R)-2-methylmalate dehydratase small subunit